MLLLGTVDFFAPRSTDQRLPLLLRIRSKASDFRLRNVQVPRPSIQILFMRWPVPLARNRNREPFRQPQFVWRQLIMLLIVFQWPRSGPSPVIQLLPVLADKFRTPIIAVAMQRPG